MPSLDELQTYLEAFVFRFEKPAFIPPDPIAIPHAFDDPRDKEIIGLFAALLAWGQRKTILAKMEDLCLRMNYQPSAFVRNFTMERDAEKLATFKHRTFQPADATWLTHNLSLLLQEHGSIESAFAQFLPADSDHVQKGLQGLSNLLFSIHPATPARLRKHLAQPNRGSACKRLNMYLRWMVRPGPVDLGIWTAICPSQLMLPLDVHSGRQARALGMLTRTQNDWRAVLELTKNCRKLCPEDPCRYDYAFFGIGANRIELETRFTGANMIDVSSI